MIVTSEIFDQGKSVNGGWNMLQFNCFGVDASKKGWKKEVIGKDFPEKIITEFLSYKDVHIKDISQIKKVKSIYFIDCPWDTARREQYLHPNWQKLRLHILRRDNFKCVDCKSFNKTLHVHHLKYNKSGFIWEVPLFYLVTLCEDCHSIEHNRDLTLSKK
jgi:hypothetical protein